jgi:hypothetical protein
MGGSDLKESPMGQRIMRVTLADGRIVRLTIGEIRALKRYVAMNGLHGSCPGGCQYDPGSVSHLTVKNLLAKGVFEMTEGGLPRFAKGVFK